MINHQPNDDPARLIMPITFQNTLQPRQSRGTLLFFLLQLLPALSAGASSTTADLFLWDLPAKPPMDLQMIYQPTGCSDLPELNAGQTYHIEVENRSTSTIESPLPKAFMDTVKPLAIDMGGMRMSVASFDNLTLHPGGKLILELLPLTPGTWTIGCSSRPFSVSASQWSLSPIQPAPEQQLDLLKVPKAIEQFKLQRHDGKRFDQQQTLGRWTLLFLGYTYCPDVCPTSLATIASAYRQLDEEIKAKLDPVFISVDPDRDTLEVLSAYVQHFHPDMLGATGSSGELAQLADQLAASYRLPRDRSGAHYAVSHTADYFLLAPNGRLVARIDHQRRSKEIAQIVQNAWHYHYQLNND